jgi:hypothetical protein
MQAKPVSTSAGSATERPTNTVGAGCFGLDRRRQAGQPFASSVRGAGAQRSARIIGSPRKAARSGETWTAKDRGIAS